QRNPAGRCGRVRAHPRRARGTSHRHPHSPRGRPVLPLAARARQKAGNMGLSIPTSDPFVMNPFAACSPVLEARRVRVTIGPRRLLDDVDLGVLPGRVTALLGPNGAGKSTLLKVMAGSLTPASGEVLLDGRPLSAWDPAACARRRAVLTQDLHLPFAFTVQEVAMMGRYPHTRRRETTRDEDIVHRCLAAADTAHLSGRLFPTLS